MSHGTRDNYTTQLTTFAANRGDIWQVNNHSIPIRGEERSESVTLGFTPGLTKHTHRPTPRNWTSSVHHLFVSGKLRCECDVFLPLSTSTQSVQCSRERPYFIASNNFTSPELTARTGSAMSEKELWKIWIRSRGRREIPKGAQRLNCY